MAEADFKYDVFISYSHKDEEWVRNILLPTLEKQGLKVCIDYRDFIAGKPAIINMADASEASRHTILVLTPRWVESEWTLYEGILSRTDDPSGLQRRTIPLLLEKCKPHKFISILSWVDFTDKKRENEAWQSLFKSLNKEVEKIEVEKGTSETWHLAHPYPMPPNFTGRKTELEMLDSWLADNTNRLFILRALGGFGKSALTWQWINTHVNPAEWTKLVFWSFYEGDASFEHFIEETLKYLKLEVPQSKREQVDMLLKAMQTQKVLLILDGFERLLRAYSNMNASHQGDFDKKLEDADRDCVNLDAEHFIKGICSMPMKSKALMTTRLSPRALEQFGQFIQGCHEKELKAMDKEDAIAFMRAQGVQKGTNHEIEEVCKLYGFHPLSLRLLAGHIMTDLRNAGDILVAQKLKVSGDITSHQNHILEISYNGISPHQQKLLSTIACFRSSTKLETVESIAENKETLDDDLHNLMERGLLQFDKKNSIFDLHPIVRRYAYDRFTAPQRKDAHVVLVIYFKAVPPPPKVEKLEDLAPVIELYHHMVRAGKYTEAEVLYYERLRTSLYFQLGAYQTIIELLRSLFLNGEGELPSLDTDDKKAFTLNELANAYSMSGQPRRAVPLFEMQNNLQEKAGNKQNLAVGLGNVAYMAQLPIGALSAAERNLRRSIDLSREIADEHYEAIGRRELGRVLFSCGKWNDSEQELETAEKLFEKEKNVQSLSVTWSYRALRFLLMAREAVGSNQSSIVNCKSAIECAQRALELADETAKPNSGFVYPIRDYIRAHWLLGAAYRTNNDLALAEENLSKALNLCRQINLVDHEADILLDVARLRYAQGDFNDAQEKASEALVITERSGNMLQGADVNLFLAELALEEGKLGIGKLGNGKEAAIHHAKEALRLAHCDDGPPYYYKVAYEEAERFLENLK